MVGGGTLSYPKGMDSHRNPKAISISRNSSSRLRGAEATSFLHRSIPVGWGSL